jgi:hypothetical protein
MSVVATFEQDHLPRGELESNDEECPVCLEVPSDEVAAANHGHGFKTLDACGHKVCWTCVRGMIGTNRGLRCPLCRAVDTTSSALEQHFLQQQRLQLAARMVQANIQLQRSASLSYRTDYEQLHSQHSRTINRSRTINGPRVDIPQMVPVFCLHCEKPGCQAKNKTKRRCVNHPQTPGCRKCNVCSECSRT